MNRLDDGGLRANLERRSAIEDEAAVTRLIARIRVAIGSEGQRTSWTGWLRTWRPGVARTAGAAASIAVVAIVAVALMLPRPVAAPGGTGSGARTPAATEDSGPRGIQVLSTAELGRVLAGRTASPGAVVVARVSITAVSRACAGCQPMYVISRDGSAGDPIAVIEGTVDPRSTSSTYLALRIVRYEPVEVAPVVELVGDVVFLSAPGGSWTIDAFLGKRGPVGGWGDSLFPIDAWLIGAGGPPLSCPVPLRGRALSAHGCGAAAWLAPTSASPTTFERGADGSERWTVSAPEGGLRVQNGAYREFAATPSVAGDPPLPVPARAIYLVRHLAALPTDCFLCPPGGAVELVARLDPVKVPTGERPSPTVAPNGIRLLTSQELRAIVDTGSAAGSIVIVDESVRRLGLFCDSVECPSGRLGDDIVVWITGPDEGRVERPVVVRIREDDAVDLLGHLILQSGGGPTFSVDEFLATRPDPGSGLFAIDGWLSRSETSPTCPRAHLEPTPAPGFDYGCWPFAWIGPTGTPPVDGPLPAGALRVQNDAYQAFAPDASGAPSRAVYLVEWLPRTAISPDLCFACPEGPLLHIVARIDPIEARPGEPQPTPPTSPEASGPIELGVRVMIDDATWVPSTEQRGRFCFGASDCSFVDFPGVSAEAGQFDADFSVEAVLLLAQGTVSSAVAIDGQIRVTIDERSLGFVAVAVELPPRTVVREYVVVLPDGTIVVRTPNPKS